MKVIISAPGKFHATYLAGYLSKQGCLGRLIISLFPFDVSLAGVPEKQIVNLPAKAVMQKIWDRLYFVNRHASIDNFSSGIFDSQAARFIVPSDIFLGWSGFSLLSLRRAKVLGAITIVERCSTHIGFQRDILKEEYTRLGIAPRLPNKGIIEKELKEYHEADFISVPSSFAKGTFINRNIPANKLICTPYGVDTDIFKPAPKNDKVFRIIYVGSLSVRKGIHYLLEAISQLKLPKIELWLIGSVDQEARSFLKKYNGTFKYFGHIDFYKLYEYYSQGSVFVLPSIEDGLAHVILQAMACGLPVICTNNSGGGDVVRNGVDGFVIPARDSKALKDTITYCYENPAICKEMGVNAMGTVLADFKWEDYSKKVTVLYNMLIKGK